MTNLYHIAAAPKAATLATLLAGSHLFPTGVGAGRRPSTQVQRQPPTRREGRRHRRHRAAPRAAAAGRSDRDHRAQRRGDRNPRDRQRRGSPGRGPRPLDHRLRRRQRDQPRLHPRRRRAAGADRREPGDRGLSRRRLPRQAGRRLLRARGCRADRGAARAAGHAIRPQRDGRRDQHHYAPAEQHRARRRAARQLRQFQCDPAGRLHLRPDRRRLLRPAVSARSTAATAIIATR